MSGPQQERTVVAYRKRLGVFVKVPEPGKVKTRLTPPLSGEEACRLYTAFITDLFGRLSRIKKLNGTVFYHGDAPDRLTNLLPTSYATIPQRGETLGDRLAAAFDDLLAGPGESAVIIGSDSPDLPVQYIKRAFLKLKHKDVVLGPAADGGYYLVGLKKPAPSIFEDIEWGGPLVLSRTIERIESQGLTMSLLPLWYDVDTPPSLQLLQDLIRARKVERSGRLMATEAVLADIVDPGVD
jgi:rSAM/selenodomain-associated transferase 1